MKAIILAAGTGSRISDDIGPIPKSTLEINGKAIIRRTVEQLLEKEIQVAICTGYRHSIIEKVLTELDVIYYNNPFFNITNNIASLWFAQNFIKDEECIIMSADIVFEDDLLNKLINAKGNLIMVTDKSRTLDGDYFFTQDSNGLIIDYGPNIPVEKRDCEYVGLSKISAACCSQFVQRLNEMIDNGESQCYFEYVFFSFIGSEIVGLSTLDVSGCNWKEIDHIEDYRKAIDIF